MTDTPAAILEYTEAFDRRVAGLSLLERAVLALRRGGVGEVAVAVPDAARAALAATLAQGRLREAPPVLVPPGPGPGGAGAFSAQAPRLLITGPVALDAVFVSAALERLKARQGEGALRLAEGVVALGPGAPLDLSPTDAGEPLRGTAVLVTSRAEGRRARRVLLAQSIKPLEIDGLVCWLLVRRLSVRLSALLLTLPITPNQVTLASIGLGLVAAVSVAVGSWICSAVGGALLLGSLVLDNCDGEIARVKHLGSTFGAWLDIYGDFLVNAAFLSGMAVGAYRRFDAPVYLWAGGFAVAAFTFYNGTVFRYIHRLGIPDEFLFRWWFDQEAAAAAPPGDDPGGRAPGQGTPAGPSALGRFLSGLKYLGRRDFFIFAYFVTSLVGVLHIAFWATVAGTAMNFVMTCYQVFLWKGPRVTG